MESNNWIWGMVVIGGPLLLALVLVWAKLNNRRTPTEIDRTERATAALYKEQDRIDKANERQPAPLPPHLSAGSGAGPPSENISTAHQAPGDARHPSDTLDGGEAVPAREWQPGEDEGRSKPGRF